MKRTYDAPVMPQNWAIRSSLILDLDLDCLAREIGIRSQSGGRSGGRVTMWWEIRTRSKEDKTKDKSKVFTSSSIDFGRKYRDGTGIGGHPKRKEKAIFSCLTLISSAHPTVHRPRKLIRLSENLR